MFFEELFGACYLRGMFPVKVLMQIDAVGKMIYEPRRNDDARHGKQKEGERGEEEKTKNDQRGRGNQRESSHATENEEEGISKIDRNVEGALKFVAKKFRIEKAHVESNAHDKQPTTD